jgi:hypothetical protein
MNLLAVAFGVPQDDLSSGGNTAHDGIPVTIDDDIFNLTPEYGDGAAAGQNDSSAILSDPYNITNMAYYGSSGSNGTTMEWTLYNWFDFIISVMGVYVGILGFKATNLNVAVGQYVLDWYGHHWYCMDDFQFRHDV